jgi:acyl-coenzyme A thioesterase PaaI-like protein
MNVSNKMNRQVSKLNTLPIFIRRLLLSKIMGRMIPYVATSHLHVEEMTLDRVVASIPNRRRVQNHIKGVHAAAMALLAETVSGLVFAMNLPDNKLPLIKTLKIDYKKRTQGSLRASATISPEQKEKLQSLDRGNLPVEVMVTDQSGREPIKCEMIWAWVNKDKKNTHD